MSESEGPPIRWGADGLIPVVTQDEGSGDVLMVAFMNAEALAATRSTGYVHYWSRSRRKLWAKGETSGNRQQVVGIYVNCDRNSLLLRVRQTGAVCHDGYPTCYYRRLEPNDALTIVRARAFDPAAVYGTPEAADEPLAAATRLLYGAYAWLRDHDLTTESGTSRRLRAPEDAVAGRVADELGELAGVLDGSHRHGAFRDDALLEATQCLYWTTLAVLRAGADWAAVRPDRALGEPADAGVPETIAAELRVVADEWRGPDPERVVGRARRALRLVGRACRAVGVDPAEAIERDLADLRGKPYLAPYFAAAGERSA